MSLKQPNFASRFINAARQRRPICAVLSWLFPFLVMVSAIIVARSIASRSQHQWMAGGDWFFGGLLLAGVLALTFSIGAFDRRERLLLLALPSFLFGVWVAIYFAIAFA